MVLVSNPSKSHPVGLALKVIHTRRDALSFDPGQRFSGD
jgi:hypothetical protein